MTPEARAEKVYPMDHYTHQVQREAHAAALRDDAARDERTSENAKLRALVQVLVDGMAGHARSCVGACSCGFYGRIASALTAAKEQGFAPTNTEDNG